MWAGRFTKEENPAVNSFNSSIGFDKRLYGEDIEGSIAHAKMLASQGIIPVEDSEKIIQGLQEIKEDIASGKLEIDMQAEDIHMFVEQVLTERIGEAGKKLHTGRSRNDQVALDMHMYVRTAIVDTVNNLLKLIGALVDVAEKHKAAIMPGYTHLQRAQPVTFGHYIMAYASMLSRDVARLTDAFNRANVSPLGCAALAGTTYPISREMTTKELKFDAFYTNSLDGVSDRDFVIEFISDLSILMMHLSRLSEEVILWASAEFKYIELDDGYATGSSIMPQKKNPDIAELIRGKTGRVYGDLIAMLTVMKGLPLAYNKDMQEDKESLFDAVDTVNACLPIFADMFSTMQVLEDNLAKAAEKGFINATDVADYLAKKGMPFRDAYKISGKLVGLCIEKGETLNSLKLEEYKKMSDMFEEDIYDAIALKTCLDKRISAGGPTVESVEYQIKEMRKFING